MKSTKIAAAVMLLGSATAATAADYLFQWDYSSPQSLHALTYENGLLIQDAGVGAQYSGSYGMWNGEVLLSSFSVGFNIEDGSGNLIHTYALSGTQGASNFAAPFLSSEVGPRTALAGGTTIVANGGFQTVYAFNTANDNYTLQFRTDLGGATVPEPASWALMIAGFGLVGAAMRRRHARGVRATA